MNKQVQKIISNIRNNKSQFSLLAFVVFVSYCVFIGWESMSSTGLFVGVLDFLTNLIAKSVILLSSALNVNVEFNSTTQILSNGSVNQFIILPRGAYVYYFILCFLFLLVPFNKYKTVLLLLLFNSAFLITRAIIINLIKLQIFPSIHNVLLVFIDPLIFIPLIVSLIFIFRENKLLRLLYDKINILFFPILNVSVSKLILLLVILTPLTRTVLSYINNYHAIMDNLVNYILRVSKYMISLFGYEATVHGKYIYLNQFWIRLENPCLGLGVFSIIIILILAIKSSMTNKAIYIPSFFIVYSFLNSVRLAVLLVYISNLKETNYLFNSVELHDKATYFMYGIAFFGFILYYYWFQDLKISKCSKDKNLT